jgi:hypothetical protein
LTRRAFTQAWDDASATEDARPVTPVSAHTCHWPGCRKPVPASMWGCREHWFQLPKPLRDRIWETYRRGQEIDKDPSDDYLDAADEVQRWIAEEALGQQRLIP